MYGWDLVAIGARSSRGSVKFQNFKNRRHHTKDHAYVILLKFAQFAELLPRRLAGTLKHHAIMTQAGLNPGPPLPIGACLSLVGCIFIIVSWWTAPTYHRVRWWWVVHLSTADLVWASTLVFAKAGVTVTPAYNESTACAVQAFFNNFASEASASWAAVITSLTLGLIWWTPKQLHAHRHKAMAIAWGLPLALSLPGIAAGAYGATGGPWCVRRRGQCELRCRSYRHHVSPLQVLDPRRGCVRAVQGHTVAVCCHGYRLRGHRGASIPARLPHALQRVP